MTGARTLVGMDGPWRRGATLLGTALATLPLLAACSGSPESPGSPGSAPRSSQRSTPAPSPTSSSRAPSERPHQKPPHPISLAALARADLTGGGLRLGAVRERTAAWTSYDDTCPPRWARATQRALVRAGVDSTLEWYDDGHAFGPSFVAAMDRTVRFLDARMPG